MHILPQLRKLERKYRDSLIVIGVHSSKFPNEKDIRNVRNAVLRYGVEHPVVNDSDFQAWRSYGVRAWPTLMFIDPAGMVIGKHEGEFAYEQFDDLVGDMIREFENAGQIDQALLPFQLQARRREKGPLLFPGKIEADPQARRLFIADSNHHRILATDLTGAVLEVIGCGEPGNADGPFEQATFLRPQGMALSGRFLFVADSENHAIRRVDLAQRTVDTIAGTGEQSLYRHSGGDPRATPLSSPYDVALDDRTLYIAMAGFHQLWALHLEAGSIVEFAGDGREDIVDGPLSEARLAQPYGLQISGTRLIFADSETSAIRTAGLGEGASVKTLVGTGLFDFGDRDGVGDDVLLQHAQGLAVTNNLAYVVDTYNHKIKEIAIDARSVRTIAGDGTAGLRDGPAPEARFNEPAGAALAGHLLFVADTNNHAIRKLDLESMHVSTLNIAGP